MLLVAALCAALSSSPLKAAQLPEQAPDVGHGKKKPDRYNIFGPECHVAANRSVCNAPEGAKVGVLACLGNATMDQRFHTATWFIFSNGKTCLYNWGKPYCWQGDGGGVPNISSGKGKEQAKLACGDQYSETATRCMAAGKYVQRTGPFLCLALTTGGRTDLPLDGMAKYTGVGLLNDCIRCCHEKADFWNSWGLDYKKTAKEHEDFKKDREEFRVKCRRVCSGAIEIE